MPIITVFGGGTYTENMPEYSSGMELGKLLGEKNFHIATGGYSGIMEAVLRGAKDYNIRRIGVTTDFFKNRQPNEFINKEIRLNNYFDRLNKLIEIGDAYIVMPGETGTLLEFAAVWALKEKGVMKINKPIVCYGDQWNEVIQTMSFYSEALLERSYLIDYAETIDDVIDNICKYFG